jgi:hypothetical protein
MAGAALARNRNGHNTYGIFDSDSGVIIADDSQACSTTCDGVFALERR